MITSFQIIMTFIITSVVIFIVNIIPISFKFDPPKHILCCPDCHHTVFWVYEYDDGDDFFGHMTTFTYKSSNKERLCGCPGKRRRAKTQTIVAARIAAKNLNKPARIYRYNSKDKKPYGEAYYELVESWFGTKKSDNTNF